MEVRKLQPAEYRDAEILNSLSFVFPLPDEKKAEQEDAYTPDRWGCFDESGCMAATLTNHDLPFYFDGGIAPARGVGGVASDPISRGQGHVRALIEHILKEDRAEGKLFSALYPFSHAFYRKFGYEVCYEHRRASFPLQALKVFRTDDPPQARLVKPDEGTRALQPLYTAFAKQYNGMIARDENTWKLLKFGNPYKAENYCYVLSRNGKDVAYASFNFRQGENMFVQTLCLANYGFVNNNGFYDLMRFLYRYTAFAQTIEILIPEDFPFCSLLASAADVQYSFEAKTMVRALHVENILKAMRHPREDGVYTLSVTDHLLTENEGCYQVAYTKNGNVSVSRCDAAADLQLSVETFAQLALGYLSLADAEYKPDVTVQSNREVLQTVFVRKPKGLLDFY